MLLGLPRRRPVRSPQRDGGALPDYWVKVFEGFGEGWHGGRADLP
jgi:hypothetical protein